MKPTYGWRGKPPRRPSNVAAKATVPKRDLVSVLQVLLEMDRLHIALGYRRLGSDVGRPPGSAPGFQTRSSIRSGRG